MSEYPKIIERPYKVYAVTTKKYRRLDRPWEIFPEEHFEFLKAFRLESDAEAYAERESEDYEVVKIEVVDGQG